jgi:hypothetical protein
MESNYDYLRCAIADDEHILEKPITLSCGHSVCRDCIRGPFPLCDICKIRNTLDFNNVNESVEIKNLLSMKFSELFQLISDRFNNSLKSLKGLFLKISKN